MIHNLYSVMDTASGVYSHPALFGADAQAVRWFKDMVSNGETAIGAHPEDYFLVRFGTWNDNNCQLAQEDRETLITGTEALAAVRQIMPGQLDAFDAKLNGDSESVNNA